MSIWSWAGDTLGITDTEGDRQKEYEKKMAEERQRRKGAQYVGLNSMRRPEVSARTKNRMAALDKESQATSLAEDPYFQGQRATLVQGGQAALSGVQNKQAATGTSGGFSNIGSANDVYDRLGAQLSQLGQESMNLKSQKADTVAGMEQAQLDAQVDYDNAVAQARMAIEAGDSDLAMQAIAQAHEAREKAAAAEKNMYGQLLGAGIQAYAGGGAGKMAGGGGGMAAAPDTSSFSMPALGSSAGYASSTPYSLMKKRMG